MFPQGFLSHLLYGIDATDGTTLGSVVLLLTGVALVSQFIPAYRASAVQPAFALRAE
jgi:ABC-type lipoprotein release transport system permease subunit